MKLKCTWTNGIIWSAITLVAGIALRWLPWNFLINLYVRPDNDDYLFSGDLVWTCFGLLCVGAVFAVAMYLMSYAGYMKKAGNYPSDLHGVAHGKYGTPWIAPMIIMLVLDVIWTVVGTIVAAVVDDRLSGFMYMFSKTFDPDGRAVLLILVVFLVGILVNVLMFFLGNRFFKPDLVQKNH